ncbi:MAG: PAS domain S-box protein [Thermodesulfobacteriota bacterium]|nr:PAS domain S-box protein [Thermodesulfobacteriota bacterium]
MKNKILVVDNHRMMLKFMTTLLEKEGFEVKTAKDGISALDVLKTYTPDVIFIDLIMPNISGEKLCMIVRSMPQMKDAFLVILSAIAAEGELDFTGFGADACIAKGPFDKMSAHVLALLDRWKKGDLSGFAQKVVGIEDINKREITKELLSTKRHLQVIIENMAEGIFELTPEGMIIYANPVAVTISGIEEEKLLGSYFTGLFRENNLKRVRDLVESAVASQNTINGNLPIDFNDRQVLLNIIPIKDQDRNSIIVILNDVSERKLVEEALDQSEEQYRKLVEISPNTILVHSEGKIQYVNPTGVKLFEASGPQELIGRPYLDIVHPDDRAGSKERMRKMVEDGLVAHSREHRLITLDGRVINVESSGTTFNHQEKIMIQTIIHNITERKQAESALTESERHYRRLMDMMPDAVAVWADEKIVFANPAAARILGAVDADKLIGRSYWKVVHPDYHEIGKKRVEQAQKGEQISLLEFKFVRLDGETIYCESTGGAITFHGGPAVVSVWRDITDRKKAEEEKTRLASQLLQAQKMEAIGTLAGGIAHDFNNLLMGIQGHTSLMLMDTDSSHPMFEHLNEIKNHVKSSVNLTKQLLGFARGGKYETRTTDLNELVKNQTRMFQRTRKEITIYESYEKNLWATEVDRGQIEQVLLNLYVNAWQAMPGGGDLTVKTENISIDENYYAHFEVTPGKYVKISIADTGEGMDEITRQRIFEPFFTTKEMGRGTGLGLASVYGIIKNHEGFINVYSEPGEGTTFTVYLPASGNAVVKEEKEYNRLIDGQGTILLVDDEEMIIGVGKQMIKRLGYDVITAGSGKEAVEIYKENQDEINLVVLDMIMPVMGGGETFEKLRKIDKNVRVLLSSGYSLNSQASEIMAKGCAGFIQKPFYMKEFSHKIAEILKKD